MQTVPAGAGPSTGAKSESTQRPLAQATRRIGRAAAVVLSIEVGLLLLTLPWTSFWDRSFWGTQWRMSRPVLAAFLLSPYFRGMVSGLGLVNLWSAATEITHFRF